MNTYTTFFLNFTISVFIRSSTDMACHKKMVAECSGKALLPNPQCPADPLLVPQEQEQRKGSTTVSVTSGLAILKQCPNNMLWFHHSIGQFV
jgi:hypothetical protein